MSLLVKLGPLLPYPTFTLLPLFAFAFSSIDMNTGLDRGGHAHNQRTTMLPERALKVSEKHGFD